MTQQRMLAFTIIALMAACTAVNSNEEPDEDLAAGDRPVATGEVDEPATPALGPGIQRLVDLALEDLESRFGLGADDVKLASAEYVTWRDASVGCPQPNMQYAQVLTNGARIVFRTSDRMFSYHSGGNRAPFYCANPAETEPLPYSFGET